MHRDLQGEKKEEMEGKAEVPSGFEPEQPEML
jgi:hypothetical protein